MRRLILFFVVVLSVFTCFAGNITEKEASLVAINWMNTKVDGVFNDAGIDTIHVRVSEGKASVYIVVFNPSAWVIVSASNRAEPVLAYSASSDFDINNIPIPLEEWFYGIEKEIVDAERKRIVPDQLIKSRWDDLNDENYEPVPLKSVSSSAGPLLSTAWDQGRYYNEMAPADAASTAGNGHVWIGCVATAMVQVMKYWEYPATGSGSHSYTHSTYGVQSANFGETSYNWSAMPNSLSSGNTEVQRVSYHAAVSVDMQFSPYGSGAFLDDAHYALYEYFKYNTSIFEAEKNSWDSETEWKNLLRSEIDYGRPVIYAGYNASGSSGHAFVCDGYDGDYFHFNWGWGGASNGNYLLSSMRPGGANYTHNQSALFGVEPILNRSIATPYVEGFETGSGYFSLSGIASLTTSESHSGSRSLSLSKPSFSSHSLNSATLSFIVPPDCDLSFWVKRITSDVASNNNQSAMLMPQYGNAPLLEFFSGDFEDEDWVNYSADLSAYEGQVLRLMFVQQNFDNYREQWMFVDDVVVTGVNQNLAPFVPQSPIPSANATGVDFSTVLKWSGGDPNGDPIDYHVYFDSLPNPQYVGSVSNNQYNISNLLHDTKYYWKIISDDGDKQSESPLWSFTTKGIPPLVESCGYHSVTNSSVFVCGSIVNDNGAEIISRGVCWGKSPNPVPGVNTIEDTLISDTFEYLIEDIDPYTVYYIRPFATNANGIAYGEQIIIRTLAGVPELSVLDIHDSKRTGASVEGFMDKLNDSIVFKLGAVWSLHAGFDVSVGNVISVDEIMLEESVFNLQLEGLPGPDTVFYRLFAENSAGIGYSNEEILVLYNTIPLIDLDADNSSGVTGNHYKGLSIEFMHGGHVADMDIEIFDFDEDTIQYAKFILKNTVYDSNEFLVYAGNNQDVDVIGNNTDTLLLVNNGNINNEEWEGIIHNVEYRIENNSPQSSVVRQVNVVVSDGYGESNVAVAYMSVLPINDPPVCHRLPAITDEAVFGSEVSILQGLWVDELDNCEGAMEFEYWWQVKSDDEISDITGGNGSSLFIDESLCGLQIRVVEKVSDSNCGGSNNVTAIAESEWVDVGRAPQSIVFDNIPTQSFSYDPIRLTGNASSGLPLTFSTNASQLIEIEGDSLYMKSIGRGAITAYQEGNDCYLPSGNPVRVIVIEKGVQEIVFGAYDSIYAFSNTPKDLQLSLSSGLDPVFSSTDTSVFLIENGLLIPISVGTAFIEVYHPGNELFDEFEPLYLPVEIEKGNQTVNFITPASIHYGNSYSYEIESNSDLPFSVVPVDGSQGLEIYGDSITPGIAGHVALKVLNNGNDLWNPIDTVIVLEVLKGFQSFQIADTLNYYYHDIRFRLNNKTDAFLDVLFETDNESVLVYNGTEFEIKGAGESNVRLIQNGDEYWDYLEQEFVVIIHKGEQNISMDELPLLTFGDAPFSLNIDINSGLQFHIQVVNDDIATIDGGILYINGAGETEISIEQQGNENWNSFSTSIPVVINRAEQFISTSLPDTIFNDTELSFSMFTASSGLEISEITSSDTNIIEVNNGNFEVKGNGDVQLQVVQSGNANYMPVSRMFSLTVVNAVGVKEFENLLISIFPSPAKDNLHISIESEVEYPLDLTIMNALGQVRESRLIKKAFNVFDLSTYDPGLYFVVIKSDKYYKIEKISVR
jgi:hypothetical protein